MKRLLALVILMIAAGIGTIGFILASPFVTLHVLWQGNTKLYDGVCVALGDAYYVIGKNLRQRGVKK